MTLVITSNSSLNWSGAGKSIRENNSFVPLSYGPAVTYRACHLYIALSSGGVTARRLKIAPNNRVVDALV